MDLTVVVLFRFLIRLTIYSSCQKNDPKNYSRSISSPRLFYKRRRVSGTLHGLLVTGVVLAVDVRPLPNELGRITASLGTNRAKSSRLQRRHMVSSGTDSSQFLTQVQSFPLQDLCLSRNSGCVASFQQPNKCHRQPQNNSTVLFLQYLRTYPNLKNSEKNSQVLVPWKPSPSLSPSA